MSARSRCLYPSLIANSTYPPRRQAPSHRYASYAASKARQAKNHRKKRERRRKVSSPDSPRCINNNLNQRTAFSTSCFFDRYVPSPIAGMTPTPLGRGNVDVDMAGGSQSDSLRLTDHPASGLNNTKAGTSERQHSRARSNWLQHAIIACVSAE